MELDQVMQAQRGDERAFAELAFGIGNRLHAVAFRILRDIGLAEDATQETLVTIWRELPGLRDPSRFDAWSWRLLVNACYRIGRQRRRWQPGLFLLETDGRASDPLVSVVDRDQLERGFRRLPPEQRAVLVLQHYFDYTIEQIADLLGIPGGTVRSRLHYARQSMRAALEADERPAVSGGRGS